LRQSKNTNMASSVDFTEIE